jgi:hypothetical protein
MTTSTNYEQLEFQAIKKVRIEARVDQPQTTTDFGVMFLRELESRSGIVSKPKIAGIILSIFARRSHRQLPGRGIWRRSPCFDG